MIGYFSSPITDVRLQMSDYRCPITANCPITLSNYNSAEWLVKNKAANAPITFQEIVTVMIKPVTTYKAKESIQSYYHEDCAIIAWDVERFSKIVHLPALYFFGILTRLG